MAPIPVLATEILIQFPAVVPEKVAEDGSSAWALVFIWEAQNNCLLLASIPPIPGC